MLHPGDTFPNLDLVDREGMHLLDALTGRYGAVLFSRGAWCPFCNAQLRAFERARDDFDELDASVVSLSVDDEATTRGLIEKHRLTFPSGHSADAHKISEMTGAFVNSDPVFLQATGFVLDPDGRVLVSAYSSGAIGRPTPDDTLGLIRHVRQSQADQRVTA